MGGACCAPALRGCTTASQVFPSAHSARSSRRARHDQGRGRPLGGFIRTMHTCSRCSGRQGADLHHLHHACKNWILSRRGDRAAGGAVVMWRSCANRDCLGRHASSQPACWPAAIAERRRRERDPRLHGAAKLGAAPTSPSGLGHICRSRFEIYTRSSSPIGEQRGYRRRRPSRLLWAVISHHGKMDVGAVWACCSPTRTCRRRSRS